MGMQTKKKSQYFKKQPPPPEDSVGVLLTLRYFFMNPKGVQYEDKHLQNGRQP